MKIRRGRSLASFAALAAAVGLFGQQAEGQTKLPDDIKARVLAKLRFDEPIEKSFRQLFVSNRDILRTAVEGDDGALVWQARFFLPHGYLVKPRRTQAEQGQFNWQEYGQMMSGGVRDLNPTPKLKPHLRTSESGAARIRIATRVLDSVDYVNRWQLNGLDTWSFTFTYHLEPSLPELPRMGPLKGKGTAQVNPSTGEFDAVTNKDVGERFGSSLADRGADEYTKWLVESGGKVTGGGPAEATSSGAPDSTAAGPAADCKDFESCMEQGRESTGSELWSGAVAPYSRAAELQPANPEPLFGMGYAHLALGAFPQATESWKSGLEKGGTLRLKVCHERTLGCNRSVLTISGTGVELRDDKGKSQFSVPPGEVEAQGVFDYLRKRAAYFRWRVATRNYNLYFFPTGVQCEVKIVPECPPDGVAQQVAVANFANRALTLAVSAVAKEAGRN